MNDPISIRTYQPKSTMITRRKLISRLVGGGIAFSVASQIADKALAADRRGGSVRLGLNGGNTSDSLDPALPQDVFMASLGSAVRERLVEIDEDGRPAPALAEEWDLSANADALSFRLRKGVQFHNGKPVTTDDIIASINHHRGEGSKSPIKTLFDQIGDVRADGSHRINIELKQRNADFIYYLGSYDAVVGPSSEGKVDWDSGIGSGPYTLDRFDPGIQAELVRYDEYHREDRGFLDRVSLIAINDDVARITAIMTGDVDLVSYVPPRLANRLQEIPTITVREVPSMLHYTIPMNTTAPPFDNHDIRMALKLAIDRQAILDKILSGHGHLGNDQPIARSQAHFADLPQRPFDPEKAKFFVRKSGLGSLSVDLHVSDAAFAGAIDTAVLFADSAKQSDINIRVVREPNDGYWSQVWRKKPFCFSWSGGRPTVDWMFSQHYAATAAYNETSWNNERFNKLLLEARVETNEERRSDLYREMQLLVRDRGGAIIPVYANHIMAHSSKVKLPDRKLGGIWTLDNYRTISTLSKA